MKKFADLSVWMGQAQELYAAGHVREAETLYRKAIEAKPDYAYAWFMLANLLLKKKKDGEALKCMKQAAAHEPQTAGYALKAADLAWKMEDKDAVSPLLDQAIAAGLQNEAQLTLAGKLLQKVERFEEAEKVLRESLAINPSNVSALNQLGNALQGLKKLDEAMACYQQVIKLKPELHQSYLNIGSIFRMQENYAEAERFYLQAISMKDDWDTAYESLTALYIAQKLWAKAIPPLKKAAIAFETNEIFWMRLAQVSVAVYQIPNAIGYCKKVLEINPKHVEGNLLLGVKMAEMGYQDEAKFHYEKAYEIEPENASVLHRLGKHHIDQSRFTEGIALIERALEKTPESNEFFYELLMARARIADWHKRKEDEAQLLQVIEKQVTSTQLSGIPILTLCYFPVPPAMHLQAAQLTAKSHIESANGVRTAPYAHRPIESNRRLRVAYLSPDIRNHAVGRLIKEVFQHHDREKFEVFVYSYVNPQNDDVNVHVSQHVEHFINAESDSFLKIAESIYKNGIDVLIDLGGYTSHTKSEVLALRPAPIQMQYIGLLDTTGAPYIDYVLADAHAIPETLRPHYSEKLLELPCVFPVSSLDDAQVAPTTRADWGLPQDAFVLACFNGAYKLSPENFDSWMYIMHRIPNSVLWLNHDSDEVVMNLRREAESRGISSERLVFSSRVSLPEHKVRSRHADLFLDTFNFNAGAVAVVTLQACVPMLTLSGEIYSSRVCGSLLKGAGLDEMICYDSEAFENKAVSLSRDPRELLRIRKHLEQMQAEAQGFFDLKGWVSGLETQLLKVAEAQYSI